MFVVKDQNGKELSIVLDDFQDAKEFAVETNLWCAVYDAVTGEALWNVEQSEWSRFSRVL